MKRAAMAATQEQTRPRAYRAEGSCHWEANPQSRYRKAGVAPQSTTHSAQFGAAPTAWLLTRSAAH